MSARKSVTNRRCANASPRCYGRRLCSSKRDSLSALTLLAFLQQVQTHEVQGELCRAALDFGARSDPAKRLRLDSAIPGDSRIDQADRLGGSGAPRTRQPDRTD